MRQVDEMIVSVELSYAEELGTQEQQFWNELGELGMDTFRITQDLALYSGHNAPAPPQFYLSGENPASRLGLFGKDGRPQDGIGARELRKLIQFGIIKVETPGQRRMANKRGVLTCYNWLLPTQ